MKVLRVGYVAEEFPYAQPGCTYTRFASCNKPSLNGDILKELARNLKFKYEFVKDDCFSCNSNESMSIVKQFRQRRIDISLDLWMGVTSLSLEKFARHAPAILRTEYTIVSREWAFCVVLIIFIS